MRILMLSQFYAPFFGGEERFVEDLSTELATRGHDVAIATLCVKGQPERETQNGVRIYRMRSTTQRANWLYIDPEHSHSPPVPDPELVLALRRIIALERPHIVHAHNWIVHSFLPLKPWSRAKLVLTLHDASLACATKKLMYLDRELCSGPGFRKCLVCAAAHYGPLTGVPTTLANWGFGFVERRMIDAIVAVSHWTADANRLSTEGRRIVVIHNFVPDDIDRPRQGVESFIRQLPDGEYLLFVGALASYKGVDVLIEAYRGLENAPPLVLIGYETTEFPIATMELPPGVVVLKDWPHDAVLEAWRRCSIAVVPSVCYESCAIVALEALAMGKPVVASNLGGLPELITDGKTGLIVPGGDAAALRDALKRLLTNVDLRRRLGREAANRGRMFQARTVVQRYETVYQTVLNDYESETHGDTEDLGRLSSHA